ncbi:hypothetical protein LTR66_015073 [Elasticomyces elasticus]|nr:hypothetical protein LTR66_015073 [Elasticomyces elasticus]
MALSAGELKSSLGPTDAHDDGWLYYNLAQQRIPDAVSNLTCDPNSVEVLLSALFLVIAYEWRFAPSIPSLKAWDQGHLMYVNGLLQNAIRQLDISNGSTTCPSFTPFCAQVLLWIM